MFQEEIEVLDEYDFCSVCFRGVRKCDFFVCFFFYFHVSLFGIKYKRQKPNNHLLSK